MPFNRVPALLRISLLTTALLFSSGLGAENGTGITESGLINLSFRDTPIEEVYEMLSVQGKVNILLGDGISGEVSVNLYGVSLDRAIYLIAESAGYSVERRGNSYLVLEREDAGRDMPSSNTRVKTFKVQYTDPEVVEEVLLKHLSRQGKVTLVPGRKMLVVEDRPEFLERVDEILAQVDIRPQQILIEARILEIKLGEGQEYGIDWKKISTSSDRITVGGTRGLANSVSGFFFDVVSPELELFLNGLQAKDRIRTLSTPKILVLEEQESEVVVGERLGYQVTTTINQVTTESVEFVESGVILKVIASVDRSGRILLAIHPEVSTGTVVNGIPNIKTTEVTTQLLAENGERIFIGGLIRNGDSESRAGAPFLSDIPLLGNLFSTTEKTSLSTETVVMITPRIIDPGQDSLSTRSARQIDGVYEELQLKVDSTLSRLPSRVDNIFEPPREEPPTVNSVQPGSGGDWQDDTYGSW